MRVLLDTRTVLWLSLGPTADLPDHRDPFDRLLIAQARAEGVPIVTADDAFTRYDVEVLRAR